MKKNKTTTYHKIQCVRRSVQTLAILLFLAIPMANWFGIHLVIGTLYSISIGDMVISDPLMVLQTVLLTKQIYLPLLLSLLIPVALAALLGRVFCGWICPQNSLSEWVNALQKKYFYKRWRRHNMPVVRTNPNPLVYWGMLLGFIMLTSVLGYSLFNYLSAPGILTSQTARLLTTGTLGIEICIVFLIVLAEFILGYRIWCKTICPVGAMLALFKTRSSLQIQHDVSKCDCKGETSPCTVVCPLNLSPKQENLYPFCMNCGLCLDMCEKTGNSSLSFVMGNVNRGNSLQGSSSLCGSDACPIGKE
ncbi:MAG: 4Fe-4S binding protein [Deferribacteres bacterium]|nr:4Fe-4S binding protein [candidate division KSB1 bacterium]MCB9500400.1 4Fe-4S binding protein [Deferribacteres bacterium]